MDRQTNTFIKKAGNLYFSLKHTPWPHFPFPCNIISCWRRQDSQLNQSSHFIYCVCYANTPAAELRKGVTNSGSQLPLSPLPTVKRCLDGKRITALLPTWDACWGLYCVCAWKALLLKCWRAMAKCRDRVREMQIVLLVCASWLYLDNAQQLYTEVVSVCAFVWSKVCTQVLMHATIFYPQIPGCAFFLTPPPISHYLRTSYICVFPARLN